MIFGVGHVERVARACEAFRAGQRCGPGVTAIAGITLLAGAGDMANGQSLGIHVVDRIAFPQGQIEVAPSIEGESAWAIEGRSPEPRPIRCGLSFASAANRFDDPGRQIDRPDTMVSNVANKQSIAAAVDDDAVRLAQLCSSGRSAISRESGIAGACERGDHTGLGRDFSNHVIVAFGDVEIPGSIELYFVRHVQRGAGC